jgi:hypothetical protein
LSIFDFPWFEAAVYIFFGPGDKNYFLKDLSEKAVAIIEMMKSYYLACLTILNWYHIVINGNHTIRKAGRQRLFLI